MLDPQPTPMLTSREVARQLRLSPVTVRRAFREGRLTGIRIEEEGWSLMLITPESVEAYRRNHLGKRGGARRVKA